MESTSKLMVSNQLGISEITFQKHLHSVTLKEKNFLFTMSIYSTNDVVYIPRKHSKNVAILFTQKYWPSELIHCLP